MKQVKLLAFMLCVLIGYFEPANATPPAEPTSAYVAMNSTTKLCPFWPNPVAPGAVITGISIEVPTGGSIISTTGGKSYPVSVIAYNQSFPLSTVENNQYFPVDEYNSLTGTTLNIPVLADGTYVLTINCSSGNVYTTKVTFSSK